jgi:hypothetical protein
MKNTFNNHTNISIIFVVNKIILILTILKVSMVDNCINSILTSVYKQIFMF